MPIAPPGRSSVAQPGSASVSRRRGSRERSPARCWRRRTRAGAAAVLHAVRGVGDDQVERASAEELGGAQGVRVDVADSEGLARLVGLLGDADADVQPATEVLVVAADRRDVGLVLEPLVLQPRLDEPGVLVEVLGVEVEAERVVAVHHGVVERGAPAAHRVEHAQPVAHHPGRVVHGQRGDVEQQLGEQLVGLAGVFLDGQQVAVELVQAPHGDRAQQRIPPPRTARTGWTHWTAARCPVRTVRPR